MVPVKEKRIRWFDAFMGLGYEYTSQRMEQNHKVVAG